MQSPYSFNCMVLLYFNFSQILNCNYFINFSQIYLMGILIENALILLKKNVFFNYLPI